MEEDEEEEKAQGLTLLNSKISYEAPVIKTLQYWRKDRSM